MTRRIPFPTSSSAFPFWAANSRRSLLALLVSTCLAPLASLRAEGPLVIKNIHLIPMTSEAVVPGQTVVVSEGRILEIGPSESMAIPKGAQIIDGKGGYLLPGLADMHTHLQGRRWTRSQANLYLANGVTTIRDLTQDPFLQVMDTWKTEIRSWKRIGPNILSGYTLFGGEAKPLEAIQKQKAMGRDLIKIYEGVSPKEFEDITREARAAGLYTIGHIPFSTGLDGVVTFRMDEIAHVEELFLSTVIRDRSKTTRSRDEWEQVFFKDAKAKFAKVDPKVHGEKLIEPFREELDLQVDKVVKAGLSVTTTMAVDEALWLKLCDLKRLQVRPSSRYLPALFWEAIRTKGDQHVQFFSGHEHWSEGMWEASKYLLRSLRAKGADLVLGTDSGAITGTGLVPGFSLHDELRILTECGFSPYEAIATGTRNAGRVAARMTGKDEFGTLEVGKRADLILVEKNPLEKVEHLRQPRGVMVSGHWLSQETLDQLLATEQQAASEAILAAYKVGGLKAALERYGEIKRTNLMNAWYLVGSTLGELAKDLIQKGRFDEAISLYRTCLLDYPNNYATYCALAEVLDKKKDHPAALQACRKALDLEPNYQPAHELLKTLNSR